ncbi:hypothetical protein FKM82_021866 [Ascaphus truei]
MGGTMLYPSTVTTCDISIGDVYIVYQIAIYKITLLTLYSSLGKHYNHYILVDIETLCIATLAIVIVATSNTCYSIASFWIHLPS